MAVEISIAEHVGQTRISDATLLRRLDWRFLLPEPGLDSVGYIGPGKDSLLPALKWVAGSLAMIVENAETPAPNPEGALCDVVVVQSSSFYDLEQGITLLKPNGRLYWEVDRQMGSGGWTVDSNSANRIRKPMEITKVVQRWGLCEAELYWHRPDFNACKEFVSLRDGAPLGFLVGQLAETGLPPWISRVARSLILQGFLPSLFRCLSVVARKGLCEG
jgi:hypothetical protein